jgi:hypothetical protein
MNRDKKKPPHPASGTAPFSGNAVGVAVGLDHRSGRKKPEVEA